MAGYSGTPLAQKLGIKPGHTVLIINAPAEYREWLGELPDVTFAAKVPKHGADVVHVFVTLLAELDKQMPRARAAMTKDGRHLGVVVQEGRENPD